MFKYAILAVVAVAAFSTLALANNVVFTFDASDFMNVTGTGPGDSTNQADARRIRAYDSAGNLAGRYGTWSQPGTYSADIPGYVAWKNSLTAGQGIAEFSIWLVPSAFGGTNPAVANNYNAQVGYAAGSDWGASARSDVFYGSAPAGWNFTVAYYGDIPLPTWYTTDPSKYLRPGTDLGKQFSFTADVKDYTAGGAGTDLTYGNSYRMWFWSDSDAESELATGLPTELYTNYFAGVNNPNQGGDDSSELDFRAFTSVTADPIPEPITMISTFLALGGLGGYIRRRMGK